MKRLWIMRTQVTTIRKGDTVTWGGVDLKVAEDPEVITDSDGNMTIVIHVEESA